MVADFQYRSLDFSRGVIQYQNQNEVFMSMFNVVIQLGAILAVMVIYFNKLNPFKPGKDKQEVRKDLETVVEGLGCHFAFTCRL